MAKKEKLEVNKGAGKIASVMAKVYNAVGKQGNIITQICTSVASAYRGVDVPTADLRFIVDSVARQCNWGAKSIGQRSSDARKIIRNYATIPEAMELYAKKSDTFTWHEALKLTTKLNGGNTPRQAVAALINAPKPASQSWDKQLTSCLTRISNIDSRSAKLIAFRKGLAALATKHGVG